MKYQKKEKKNKRQRPDDGAWSTVDITDRAASQRWTQLTPDEITRIAAMANSGDTSELCKLADEIERKNWTIGSSMETRRNALIGCSWTISPGDNRDVSVAAANAFATTLNEVGCLNDYDTFTDLLSNLLSAVIAPFAVSELIWENGNIIGFDAIEARHFTLRDGFDPKLITVDQPLGMDLPANKYIVHFRRRGSSDPARSGLIHTLVWLHVFQNYPIKDWLGFAERFGMPFVVARCNRNTYKDNRDVIQATIRSFGPRGGGVFDKDTEIQLLQAASSGKDIYVELVRYCDDAIKIVLLGQTASSGDAAGLSGGDAQSQVRNDILKADARAIESVIRSQIAAPWTYFNYPGAAVPKLMIDASQPEDKKAAAEVQLLKAQKIATLATAGYRMTPEALKEEIGLELTYTPPVTPEATPMPAQPTAGAAADAAAMAAEDKSLAAALTVWLGPAAKAVGDLTADDLDEATFAAKLADLVDGAAFGSSEHFETLAEKSLKMAYEKGKQDALKNQARK